MLIVFNKHKKINQFLEETVNNLIDKNLEPEVDYTVFITSYRSKVPPIFSISLTFCLIFFENIINLLNQISRKNEWKSKTKV